MQFMYAASLALLRDIHSQMFLGLPLLFVVEAKRGGVTFTSWKKVDGSEDPKQKSKTGCKPKRELGELRSHLFQYFLRGLETNFISFTFLLMDQNPAPKFDR